VLDATKFLTAKIHSLYVEESNRSRESETSERSESGVRHFGKVRSRTFYLWFHNPDYYYNE